jgi:hypothetical protein
VWKQQYKHDGYKLHGISDFLLHAPSSLFWALQVPLDVLIDADSVSSETAVLNVARKERPCSRGGSAIRPAAHMDESPPLCSEEVVMTGDDKSDSGFVLC